MKKRGGGGGDVFEEEGGGFTGWYPIDTLWFFANPYEERPVTCLENVYHLNWKARQKAEFVT